MRGIILYKLKSLDKIDEFKIEKYVDFCIENNQGKHIPGETEHHHILPKADSLFPEYIELNENPWNGTYLKYADHWMAHSLLADAIENDTILYAWWKMNSKNGSYKYVENLEEQELYKLLRKRHSKLVSDMISKRNQSKEHIQNRHDTMSMIDENGVTKFQRMGDKISKTLRENKSCLGENNSMFGKVVVKERNNPENVLCLDKNYDKMMYTHIKTKFIRLTSQCGEILYEGWFDQFNYNELGLPANEFSKLTEKTCYTNEYVKRILNKRGLSKYIQSQLKIISTKGGTSESESS